MATTTPSPESAAQLQLDGYNARDIDIFCSAYSDDVQLLDMLSGAVLCDGIEKLRVKYREQFERCPDLHCTLVKRIVCGNVVIDEELVKGLAPGKIVHATAIYEVQNGLIRRGWFVKGDAQAD
ncbi:MAG: nuclear transport factor 2 family protein [Ignavibacteria bacterium]|nr:nuclear transport factor 2 family protein [Ignavibacteria bacterium]